MPISILDLPVEAIGSHATVGAVSAGANRIAIYMAAKSDGGDASAVTSVTLGGQNMSEAVVEDQAGYDVALNIWILKEAGIAAMTDTVLSVTGGAGSAQSGVFLTIQGASQVAAITAAKSFATATSGAVSLTRAASSWTLAASLQDWSSDTMTLTNPANVGALTFTNGSLAYGYQADSAGTSDTTWSGAASRNTVAVALNFEEGATGPSISNADDVTLGTVTNYTRANWTESATSAIFTVGTSVLTATSVTDTTITWPALANGLSVASLESGTLEVSGPTESATITVNQNAPVGYNLVTLAGTLNTTDTGYLFDYGGTPVVGDQVVSDAVLLANGDVGENAAGTYQAYYLDISDAQIQLEEFSILIGDLGVVGTVSGCFNDALFDALSAHTGAMNDKLFKYLRAQGHTGALNDMLQEAGGWKQVLTDLGVLQ